MQEITKDEAFFKYGGGVTLSGGEPLFQHEFALADEVVLAKIYPARETDDLGISSDNIRVLLEQAGTSAHYFETFEEIEKFILQHAASGDLVITMGAGDVVKIGEDLISK